jgi:hypothetical protein
MYLLNISLTVSFLFLSRVVATRVIPTRVVVKLFLLSLCIDALICGVLCGVFISLLCFYLHKIYTVSRTPWTGDQPVARPLPTHSITKTENKCTQTSIL